jgi:site-specific DNA-methyltransferase (adenine-specific)
MEINKIYCGNCLDIMPEIESKSIDMILCDLPYGTTACKWDQIIPFEPLWAQYKRLIKDYGAIVLTAGQPFTSALVMSNPGMFKYAWVWKKTRAANFMNVKNKPLCVTEDVLVFSNGTTANRSQKRMMYFPQGVQKSNRVYKRPNPNSSSHGYMRPSHTAYHGGDGYKMQGENYPKNILEFPSEINKTVHPTQKPVALFEYLIKTYTNEGDLVLDNCIGSGTTAIAAINTKRNFIGIEKEQKYVDIANERISKVMI